MLNIIYIPILGDAMAPGGSLPRSAQHLFAKRMKSVS